MPEPTSHDPDDPLQRFLAAHPRYRADVCRSEEHGAYAMPAWLADVFRVWAEVQAGPPIGSN